MIIQPNAWSCLLASFAMAFDMPLDELTNLIGHDGSSIVYPDAPEPSGRRCFHVQEFIHLGFSLGFYIVQFDAYPTLCVYEDREIIINLTESFKKVLQITKGVLTGTGPNGGRHAAFWDMRQVIDPNGYYYAVDQFGIESFFSVRKKDDLQKKEDSRSLIQTPAP